MFFRSADIERARKEIEQAKKIVITTHKSPDGDAIGSSLALKKFLSNMGKEVHAVIPDPFSEVFDFLPGETLDYSTNESEVNELLKSVDLIFCLDYNNLYRIGPLGDIVKELSVNKVLIDHHTYPSEEFDILLSSPSTGSTCELIFEFIQDLDEYHLLDKEIATCIMNGLITDTGSFKYGTTANTFSVAAKLLQLGADLSEIQKSIFDNNSLNRLRLNGYAMSNKLELIKEGKIAMVSMTQEELEKFEYRKGDTEGLVNQALSIKGVEIAIYVSSRDNETRLSFRSKNDIKVNGIASEHFHGGGHEKAAGGKSDLSVQETIDKLKLIIPQYV